jgi:hypothetical protein
MITQAAIFLYGENDCDGKIGALHPVWQQLVEGLDDQLQV